MNSCNFKRQNPEESNNIPLKKPKVKRKNDFIRDSRVQGKEFINKKGILVPERKTGPDCKCKRLKCLNGLTEENKKSLIESFNNLLNKNEQDSFLSGLISFSEPAQRRSRKVSTAEQKGHCATFKYKIRVNSEERPVCVKAFCGLYGITYERVRRIRKALITTGMAPKDLRGRHPPPHKLKQESIDLIEAHIKSFACRQSHYSRRKNPNTYYLPETLTIKKMYELFKKEHPDVTLKYFSYYKIFTTKFNLKFGLPKTDTCSTCDSFEQKIKASIGNEELQLTLKREKLLHLSKAEKFYELKRKFKNLSREDSNIDCISIDYMQNLPLPHIRTNAIFFARQLWYFVFGCHNEKNNKATMYCYPETVAKKGQNEVASLLFHFLRNIGSTSRKLYIISDGCSGQNKNYVLMRFFFILVHLFHMYDTIIHLFPVRGHSFLSNDQDFALIEKHKKIVIAETPADWDSIILNARNKPCPFDIVNVSQDIIYDINEAVHSFFLRNGRPPVQIKGAKMLKYTIEEPDSVLVRHHYSASWTRCLIRNKKKFPSELSLPKLYNTPIPLNPGKKKDVESILQYLSEPGNVAYYQNLLGNIEVDPELSNIDIDSEDNSSGWESN